MKPVPAIALLSLLALGAASIITNPNENDYADYLAQNISVETKETLCNPEGFSNWLGKVGAVISEACQGIVTGGKALTEDELQTIIKDETEYKNRLFFSTYDTQMPIGDDYRAVGIFGQFILQEQASEAESE
ncbi:DUF4359 domain-containing protein [cf. Phormidesmis sp. LEGE 11477]|uniref:DUF4359 domain-containing protein n=1 Tax=cf. Phormidesmis sp. LEGE 11477 TaxID=1828680 RepID=UPI0018809EDA|nr:DUF4359 domain-containing protein [cf. Phormidesmis sp. LEGE 11477]MBE9064345.1 DUF4359 domain-containing protein [cf. Phormidesmis sp. LEGE 11477]